MQETRARIELFGLLSMMMVTGALSTSAQAQGPFWYHRSSPVCGCQAKINAQEPEYIAGGGGEQRLKPKISSTEVELTVRQAQVKGEIYNNNLQAQAKIQIVYSGLRLAQPNFPNCVVTVGQSGNAVKVYGHQMWKYDPTPGTQLNEQPVQQQRPDWVFLPTEPQQGATELPNSTLTTIKFSGAECGVLAGTVNVKGSIAAAITPPNLGEWGFTESQRIWPTNQRQHFFNGKENVGVETKLTLGSEPMVIEGEFSMKTIGRQQRAPQEIAHLEG